MLRTSKLVHYFIANDSLVMIFILKVIQPVMIECSCDKKTD
jgi:hypothetical protein